MVTVALPSAIWAGISSKLDAFKVKERVSFDSFNVFSIVLMSTVLDDSPSANEIVSLIAR